MAGLNVLFQQRALSLLLVEWKEVLKKVRAFQHTERGRGNVIHLDPLNIWRAELSYVATCKLDILFIMVHVPVAKLELKNVTKARVFY